LHLTRRLKLNVAIRHSSHSNSWLQFVHSQPEVSVAVCRPGGCLVCIPGAEFLHLVRRCSAHVTPVWWVSGYRRFLFSLTLEGEGSDAVYTLRQGVLWFHNRRCTLLPAISVTAVRRVRFVFPAPFVAIQKQNSFLCSSMVLNLSKTDNTRGKYSQCSTVATVAAATVDFYFPLFRWNSRHAQYVLTDMSGRMLGGKENRNARKIFILILKLILRL